MSNKEKKNHTGLKVATVVLASAALAAAYFKATYELFKKSCIKGNYLLPIDDNETIVAKSNNGWLSTVNHQALHVTSHDGLLLHATYIKSEQETNEWIVLVHGLLNNSDQVLSLAKTYHAQGYHVLCPDLRACGQSEGQVITYGAFESNDLCLWMDLILQMDSQAKIILHGLSIGATSSLIASSQVMHTALKGVISDGAFCSYVDLLKHVTSSRYHLPSATFVPGVSYWVKKLGKFSYEQTDALQAISIKGVPTLFFQGTNDRYVPTSMVYRLANALMGASIVELVEGGKHGTNMYDNKYMSKCLLFVQKQMFND